METTTADPDKDRDSAANDQCENDWCDGSESGSLPCFECFDIDREYDAGTGE